MLDQPTQFADAGLGFRAWGFSADLSLNPGLLAGQSVNRSSGWGDPLIGGRYHYDFGNGLGLTAYGDCRRFRVGAHVDWQIIGTIDYTLNSWINLHLGYRSLNFNYQAFARFLVTHRRSTDLEADIRANLRREGLIGAIEIIMHHEAREIGE